MKIQKIETFTREPISLTRVTADDGSVGWGQIAPYRADITAMILHRQMARHFLGASLDFTSPGAGLLDLANGAIEKEYKFPGAYVVRAVGGIETALWDLLAKKSGVSVATLAGGGKASRFRAYGSSMSREIKPEDEATRLLKLRQEQGFDAFKVRVGQVCGKDVDAWPGRSEDLVRTMRKRMGPEVALLVDGNSGFSPAKAIELGKLLQDQQVSHFEEPCPYWELEQTAEVAAALTLDVAGGEQDTDLAQFRRMVRLKAVDIVQPDILYLGGFARSLEAARYGHAAGLACTPHAANVTLVTVFTLHLLSAVPNPGKYLEFCIEDWPWQHGIFEPALEVKGGKVKIPDAEPGWGVRVRQDWLDKAVLETSTNR